MLRRATLLGAVGLCAVGTQAASAAESVELDMRGPHNAEFSGPVAAPTALASGQRYLVTVKGTGSIWPMRDWRAKGTICGAPEQSPLFPTPGAENGLTGWDAEAVFAVPPGPTFRGFKCSAGSIPFHVPDRSPGGFQIDTGQGFGHVEPIGGARSVPRSDHTYTYELVGTGKPIAFRFVDRPADDNYGRFRITIQTAAQCAASNCTATAGTANDSTGQQARSNVVTVSSPSQQARTTRSCASRRAFDVHVRNPSGVRIVSGTATVAKRTLKTKVGHRGLTAAVRLNGLPVGRYVLTLTARTSRGQVLAATRSYRTCTPRKRTT